MCLLRAWPRSWLFIYFGTALELVLNTYGPNPHIRCKAFYQLSSLPLELMVLTLIFCFYQDRADRKF